MTAPRLRSRAMTEQAAQAAVDQACRSLRLPTIRARVEEIAAAAQREQLTYWGFLAELLLSECDDRDRRRTIRRVKAAGFPREKWLADFDFEANPAINPATIHTLAKGDWIRKNRIDPYQRPPTRPQSLPQRRLPLIVELMILATEAPLCGLLHGLGSYPRGARKVRP